MYAGRAVFMIALLVHLLNQSSIAKTDAVRELSAIRFEKGGSERVALRSTDRLAEASGAASVERKGGTTFIELEMDSMKPASLFGGDYNTYVLWVVPPGGPAQNLGEIAIDGEQARLRAATPASAFAILVTAEPHRLVSSPSAFVVLENEPDSNGQSVMQPLVEGVYYFTRTNLDGVKEAKGQVRTDVKQAFTAVRLARRSGAATLAYEQFELAQQALKRTLILWQGHRDRSEVTAQAIETMRLAVAAQRLSENRALQRDSRHIR